MQSVGIYAIVDITSLEGNWQNKQSLRNTTVNRFDEKHRGQFFSKWSYRCELTNFSAICNNQIIFGGVVLIVALANMLITATSEVGRASEFSNTHRNQMDTLSSPRTPLPAYVKTALK